MVRSPTRRLRAEQPHTLADEPGLRSAYAAHGAELYRFAVRALGDEGAAQDVVQETFLRAWRAADRYDSELSSLRVWLFAIARNVVVDQARRRASRSWPLVPADAGVVEGALAPVPDETDRILSTWLVEAALVRLSDEHRHVLVETYLRGRPYDEVAAERGVPVGTLRSRTFYALKALRVVLDEMGVTP